MHTYLNVKTFQAEPWNRDRTSANWLFRSDHASDFGVTVPL